jgi:integrase
MLKELIGERKDGFVFRNAKGRPLAQSNVLRRSLHPVLESLSVPKAGFHSFRRFRATHLSKSRVPESLVKFWMGHSETNQTEEYMKLFDEVEYRREVADTIDWASTFCRKSQLSVMSVENQQELKSESQPK